MAVCALLLPSRWPTRGAGHLACLLIDNDPPSSLPAAGIMRWRDRRGSLLSTRGISPYSMMVVGERLRVAFFGSDRFSRICLARLLANNGNAVARMHPPSRN